MTPPARGRLAAVGAVGAVLTAAVLAGCTSNGGTTDASTPPSSGPATSSAAPTTTAPPTTSSPTISEVPPSPPTSASPTTSTSTAPALAACADLDVTVTRVPGGGGVSYGLISVTNRGSARCGLPGIPVVRLLDDARAAMTATATAITGTANDTALEPGAVASTLVEDRLANCQANTRSAFVEVTATPAAAKVVAALALPPCTLVVKPFAPGSSPSP